MPRKDPIARNEYCKGYMREYRRKNPEKFKTEHHKELDSNRHKKWYAKNGEKMNKKKQEYRKNHPIEMRAQEGRWRKTIMGKFWNYKQNAKLRGLFFELTFQQFKEYWKKPCSYCGGAIETVGLDRTDNSKGYIMENITSCCSICNYMKRTLPTDFFIEQCQKIIKFYRGGNLNGSCI